MTVKRILIWVGVGLGLVALVIVGLVIFLLTTLSQPGERTARFLPARAPAYVSVNLRPGVSQLNKARQVISRLEATDAFDERDDLLDEFEDDSGIHILDDVTDWLGTDVSFALLDADMDRPEWIVMVQISDRAAADDFADDFAEYLEDELYTEFDTDDYRGVDLWVASDEPVALGLSDDYLFMADSEDTIEDMVRNMESPPENSLDRSESFVAAQQMLPDERVFFAFAQVDELTDFYEEAIDPYGDMGDVMREIRRNVPDFLAASVSFIDDGVRMDLAYETPSGSFSFDTSDSVSIAGVLPADTLAVYSSNGIHEGWEQVRDTIEDFDEDVADDFDDWLDDFEDQVGYDLELDVISALSGEIAMALLPSDVNPDLFSGGIEEGGTIEALVLIGLEDSMRIEDVLDEMVDWLEDETDEIRTDRDPLGDYEAVSFRIDDDAFLRTDYEPSYVVTEDWAVGASTFDSLEAFHDVLTGDADSLDSADTYRNIVSNAPDPLHVLLYADIAGIAELLEDALDDRDLDDYEDNVRPFAEVLQDFMFAGSVTEEKVHFTAALTLAE